MQFTAGLGTDAEHLHRRPRLHSVREWASLQDMAAAAVIVHLAARWATA
jgi:hypothetical protein